MEDRADNRLIPLDDETCEAIEAALAEAMERKEQNRLAAMWMRQMRLRVGLGVTRT